jgi:hypothetical protein
VEDTESLADSNADSDLGLGLFLESHLGSHAFAAALLDERVTKIQLLINELMKLDDKQVAYILLRHCIALPKFRFALRTCPTELITF